MKANNKLLYHGATCQVDKPLVSVGRPELDFGPGFYLTGDRDQTEKWARTKASRKKDGIACLNVYSFDSDAFTAADFRLKCFDSYDVEWLDFIAFSRKGRQPWVGYDWIEGGIANDSVISTVDAYVDGFINANQALDQLVNEELRHQVCIRHQDIIDRYLKFEECIEL